jgi:hypothetical protein
MLDSAVGQTYLQDCASCRRTVAEAHFTTDERTMGSTRSGSAVSALPTTSRLAASARPAWALKVALR